MQWKNFFMSKIHFELCETFFAIDQKSSSWMLGKSVYIYPKYNTQPILRHLEQWREQTVPEMGWTNRVIQMNIKSIKISLTQT